MPTTILYNGTIYTMDPAQPRAQAIAIRDGRVVAVGSEGKVQAAVGRTAEGINLAWPCCYSGLNRCACPLDLGGARPPDSPALMGLPISRMRSARLASMQRSAPAGCRVAAGITRSGRWPTAADLDTIVPERPGS